MKQPGVAGLLSFNGGFVDTAGFLGLQGLFTSHVTGNFVTLGAALVFGTHGVIAKLIALPEFALVVALARLMGAALRRNGIDDLRSLLVVLVLFIVAFFDLLHPEPGSDVASIRARFVLTVRGIIWFAAGCAAAALLYYWVGFWCLAVPAAVGAASAMAREQG